MLSLAPAAIPPSVFPLVRRHAEDAAFYWQQIDASPRSLRLTWERFAHFDRLLAANLKGLSLAGPLGMQVASEGLARWRQPGEVFVCAWLALTQQDEAGMGRLLELVSRSPDTLLRGLISALCRVPDAIAAPWLAQTLENNANTVAQVAAWRAVALGASFATPGESLVIAALTHESPFVRAAACRAAHRIGLNAEAIAPLLNDADVIVRAEAAIALSHTDTGEVVGSTLSQCVQEQARLVTEKTGWYRHQAMRRLDRWVRYLAVFPVSQASAPAYPESLPPRQALTYMLHHGDPRAGEHILDLMALPDEAAYAAWVWQTLYGVDLNAEGLLAPAQAQTSDEALTVTADDATNELPQPDIEAIRAYGAIPSRTSNEQGPILFGQPRSMGLMMDMLTQGTQTYRAIAAQVFAVCLPRANLNVRASASTQDRALSRLKELVS